VTGTVRSFIAKVREVNPEDVTTPETIVPKTMPAILADVWNQVIQTVTFIKLRPLISCLLSFCASNWVLNIVPPASHEVRWLLRGQVLTRDTKLRDKVQAF
jgi:hypothetical protein